MKITKREYPQIVKMAKYCYPEYKGRKFYLKYEDNVDVGENANWSGGTRTYYKFVRLDGKLMNVPDFAPWKRPENEVVELVSGVACVTHSFFQGHDCGLTVIFSKSKEIK